MIEQQQVIQQTQQNILKQKKQPQDPITPSVLCPYRMLTNHWLCLSRPQYSRTCGISSLVSLWNFQFSKLGNGNKQPITIEQAMLKLNLIGNGSISENNQKNFKKTTQLTQQNKKKDQQPENNQKIINANKNLHDYVDSIDFGCFTGNDTLLRWYRLLCRNYGGSGRSYIFYKTNSDRSYYKTQKGARKALVEGLKSEGKICFIYHAQDHYFCPTGYEFIPKDRQNSDGQFESSELYQNDNELYIMVGESSKMFPCLHSFKWSQIELDLTTYRPKKFNIRRRNEGVIIVGKQNSQSKTSTLNCIMAFQKLKD